MRLSHLHLVERLHVEVTPLLPLLVDPGRAGGREHRVSLEGILSTGAASCAPPRSGAEGIAPDEALLRIRSPEGETLGQVVVERVHAVMEEDGLRIQQVEGLIVLAPGMDTT